MQVMQVMHVKRRGSRPYGGRGQHQQMALASLHRSTCSRATSSSMPGVFSLTS
ncbi:hypothetical protein STRTUCAR8_04353 [Streptomyces turgidiscabies Car8]|uniref:Uncharacterized protein n=1 Tax=Streptomyces turgidiscabies (strain Car8) TaxID=698760 RepID=L7EXU3_STRT8|nr:hypothetical protein STRTUCAR8_04353 [Streptomyces turgidiscabies Car8]